MNAFKHVGLIIFVLCLCLTSFCQSLAKTTWQKRGSEDFMWVNENIAVNDSRIAPRVVSCPGNDFSFTRDVCRPLALTIVTDAIGYNAIKWDFGDGAVVTGDPNPTHLYSAFGNYNVSLYLEFPGCFDTVTKRVSIDVSIDQQLLKTPDTVICAGTGLMLRATPGVTFCWTPTTFLDDPESSTPNCRPTTDMTYFYRASIPGTNLISNGDFSQGNTGFSSAYIYSPASGVLEGNYNIGNNVTAWQPSFSSCNDRTTGTGNMMMVNGSNFPTSLWSVNIPVTPNTNYELGAWLQNLTSPSPASLAFYINGELIGNNFSADAGTCNWKQFKGTWSSAAATIAQISIVNETTIPEGNDFAIDDISFTPLAILQDSISIVVEKPVVQTINDTVICASSSVQLATTGGQIYSWSPAAGLSNPNIGNPVASPASPTQYIVTGTTSNGCSSKDTLTLGFHTKPPLSITPDTVVCKNGSVQLMVSGGSNYVWSPAATLNDPYSANPIASPAATTMYYVNFKDNHTCDFNDSVEVDIRPDPVFQVKNPGYVCYNDTVQLIASGGNTYSWLPAAGLSNPAIANPIASPAVSTQYNVTITETVCNYSASLAVMLNVEPTPVITAVKSNDLDCTLDQSQLTASGGSVFEWMPAGTLSNPSIANPIARPRGTTNYIVAGTNEYGCTGYDTVTVKVEAGNEGQFLMPNAFTPNNDGLNDCFGIRYWGVVEQLEFSVFNRWGQRVFYSSNPQQCWDGTFMGKRQDGGVYIYIIKAKTFCAESVTRKGSFTLIR